MNKATQQKGAALLLFIILFLVGSLALSLTLVRTIYSDLVVQSLMRNSKQSYYAADSGLEDMAYRYIAGMTVNTVEALTVGNITVTTTAVYDGVDDKYDIVADAVGLNVHRSSGLSLYMGSGASFNFGVQTGNGGFQMSNGSSVQGNVFSNGTIEKVGGGSATIYGDAISAGPTGHILDITTTGSARSRVIENSDIGGSAYAYTLDGGQVDGDAYYFEKIGGAVVYGNEYGHVPEESPTTLPITDAEIDAIKQDIIDNGTVIASTDPECVSGEYFTDTDITLGFVKIECDLRVKKQGAATVLTLTGPVWVEGNVQFEAGPDVQVDAAVGNRTVPFIADNESNRLTSSSISVEQGTSFTGSGSPKSYVLLISQNEDAETGALNNVDAITLAQSSAGDLLVYAGHGRISLGNSVSLKEITGYLISLGNSAEVIYESGLVNILFTAGPGGGFTLNGWKETY